MKKEEHEGEEGGGEGRGEEEGEGGGGEGRGEEEGEGGGGGGGGEEESGGGGSDDDDSEQLYDLDEFSIGYTITTRVEEHEFSEVLHRGLSHLIVGDWILRSFVLKIRKMCTIIRITEKEPHLKQKLLAEMVHHTQLIYQIFRIRVSLILKTFLAFLS